MPNVKELLQDADPLRHETPLSEETRERLLRSIAGRAADRAARSSRSFRPRIAILATLTSIALAILLVGSQMWPRMLSTDAALHAAVRFEMRLAEDQPSAGLREVRVAASDKPIYLHEDVVVTNDDVTRSRVVPGNNASQFGVAVEFNATGAEKMRRATSDHIGRPVAILIDDDVVAAPVVRAPINGSAVLSGDFTKAEAERIANGIGVR
jgi:preprotein translocase subunit SecD